MQPFLLALALIGFTAPAFAAVEPKVVLDNWDAAYLQGAHAGYVHTYVHEIEKSNVKLLRATMELRLNVLRSGETIQLGMDTGTYETVDGKVVGTFLKHYLGTSKTLEITGIVDGKTLRLTLDKAKSLKPVPWNPGVIGLAKQQRILRDRDVKPGQEITYLSFEPSINVVIKTTVQAKDFQEVELFGSKQKQRFLRVESRAEKIDNVQLPALVSWLGDDLTPVRAEADIPPFGRVTLYRTTRSNAQSPGTMTKLTDIGTSQYVKLARRIAHPYETTSALYRITVRDKEDPADLFAVDGRQQVTKVQGKSIELLVSQSAVAPGRANASPSGKQDDTKAPDEYTQSSYFITSSDIRVKKLAQMAVGGETDPWKKALRIEKWVNLNVKVTSDEVLAPADHVARTLRGDCTEFAMLMAAMCRAQGIPSRTAVGLIYADVRTGPVFAFHMWTEVWMPGVSLPAAEKAVRGSAPAPLSQTGQSGCWIALDATLGKGKVGATHLKIRDQSWHDVYDQSPLLPVFDVLGRLSIEVVRIDG
jgi:transglutaminase-like putative cysteine protease